MTLLNYKLGDNKYVSVIISGLVVIGFCDDRGWLNAKDYTTKYLGVIKVVRMLVVYQSYIEREDGYKINQRVIDNIQAQLRIEPDFLMMPCKGIVKIPVFTIQIYAYVNPSSSIPLAVAYHPWSIVAF